jgi:hypothetical protein
VKKYVTPPNLASALKGKIDPNGGFLCMSSHWRPDPEAGDPEMPGHKLTMSSYIPASPRAACLCGSGRRYGDCCRPKRFWHPICPNPGMEGYRLTKAQSATFDDVDGAALRRRLTADPRFRCVDDSQASAFWIYHGDPVVEDRYGLLCFGDLELMEDRSLLVTAMSDLRMQTLLAVLQEIAGDLLDEPRRSRDPDLVIDKRTGKSRVIESADLRSRKRRKR